MKLKYPSILFIALCLLFSCQRTLDTQQEDTFKLNLSIADEMTRVTIGQKTLGSYPVTWQEGDKISVGKRTSKALAAEYDGRKSAIFEFTSLPSAPYNVLYPANTSYIVNFPSYQPYLSTGFAVAPPMYAASNNSAECTLKHLSSALVFTVCGSKTLSAINLTAVDGTSISGNFTMAVDENGKFNGTWAIRGGISSTGLDLGDGVQLSSEGTTFRFLIPSGSYSSNFRLTMVDSEGGRCEKFVLQDAADRTLKGGEIVEIPKINYSPSGKVAIISSSNDLMAFCNDHSAMEAYITADIDITGQHWATMDVYNGVLDGLGHTIKGLDAPLMAKSFATVRNLTLDCTIIDNAASAQGGAFARSHSGLISNCTLKGSYTYNPKGCSETSIYHAGGFVGNCHGIIEACTLEATLNFGNFTGSWASFGGMAGNYYPPFSTFNSNVTTSSSSLTIDKVTFSSETGMSCGMMIGRAFGELSISGCSTAGTVNVNSYTNTNTNKGRLDCGGIVGYLYNSDIDKFNYRILNCKNTGRLNVKGSCSTVSTARVGGIVGNMLNDGFDEDDNALIESCTNSARIIMNDGGNRTVYAAGICADARVKHSTFRKCKSTGLVSISGASSVKQNDIANSSNSACVLVIE